MIIWLRPIKEILCSPRPKGTGQYSVCLYYELWAMDYGLFLAFAMNHELSTMNRRSTFGTLMVLIIV